MWFGRFPSDLIASGLANLIRILVGIFSSLFTWTHCPHLHGNIYIWSRVVLLCDIVDIPFSRPNALSCIEYRIDAGMEECRIRSWYWSRLNNRFLLVNFHFHHIWSVQISLLLYIVQIVNQVIFCFRDSMNLQSLNLVLFDHFCIPLNFSPQFCYFNRIPTHLALSSLGQSFLFFSILSWSTQS